ncbi:MAG: nodulation protein NodH [Pseudomonadota bacterium]
MAPRFDFFVILADMRTGSNALEEALSGYDGLKSYGEVFNPQFIGKSGQTSLLGRTMAMRDDDPEAMIAALRGASDGIAGFRLFSDHDPRVLEMCLKNRKCAKIILTRNPAESYVSLKIARATGQWWLGDVSTAKPGRAIFNGDEFDRYLDARQTYLATIRQQLQQTGQTAFLIDYSELQNSDVIDGAARFLGAGTRTEKSGRKGKIQNPRPMEEKVSNFAEMKAALAGRDPFGLDAAPEFEPTRGPNVPAFATCLTAPLLYLPVKCAGEERVFQWMRAVDGGAEGSPEIGRTQKQLRQWKRRRGRHAAFTVIAHPVARAWEAFCRFILPAEPPAFTAIRTTLIKSHGLVLPDDPSDDGFGPHEAAAAFAGFLRFLKGNLSGQTAIRVDSAWASQVNVLQGMSRAVIPDLVIRSSELGEDLSRLARAHGAKAPQLPDEEPPGPLPLSAIYDDEIEAAARAAYQRDYMMFGFGAWRAP